MSAAVDAAEALTDRVIRDFASLMNTALPRRGFHSSAIRFGEHAEDYERGRPGWPIAAVSGFPGRDVLDLASGTGKLTRELVRLYPSVVAVDADRRMQRVGVRLVPEAQHIQGRAEAIPLPDTSVDAVFVASTFHWFDHERAIPEIMRVLRPSGLLVILENEWLTITPALDVAAQRVLAVFGVNDEASGRARQRERRWRGRVLESGFRAESEYSYNFTHAYATPDDLVSYYVSRTGSKASVDRGAAEEMRRELRVHLSDDSPSATLRVDVLAFAVPDSLVRKVPRSETSM